MQRPCGGEEHGTVEKHKGGQCAWNITGIEKGDKSKTGQGLKSHGKDLGCDLNIRVKPLKPF